MDNRYCQLILELCPRIISNLDRDADSPTYGSFDRHFWLYHTTDFSNAILQQSGLTLALVYLNDFPGNLYFQRPPIKEWALAAVDYWGKIQHHDGSFDEYWLNERGLPPTVFSTFAVSETVRLLGLTDKQTLWRFKKAADFLGKNKETFASNQEAASVAALYSVYLTTKDEKILKTFLAKLDGLKELQSAEGFFFEQNGADAGYLSTAINYLAWVYKMSGNKQAKEMADRALEFFSYLVQPDGSVGGEYGSRNTEYFLPFGFKALAASNSLAAAVLKKVESYVFSSPFNFPVDDHYLLHYLGPSYALALAETSAAVAEPEPELPFQKKLIKHFPEAGLLVVSQPGVYWLINFKKGGVFKLYSHGRLLANDLGYRLKLKNGKMLFSEYGYEKVVYNLKATAPLVLEIKKFFSPKSYILLSPLKRFAIYFCSLILGRGFRKLVKQAILQKSKISSYQLIRKITLAGNLIVIADKILPSLGQEKLIRANSQSIKVIPSAKFFQITELDNKIRRAIINQPPAVIETTIDLERDEVKVNY